MKSTITSVKSRTSHLNPSDNTGPIIESFGPVQWIWETKVPGVNILPLLLVWWMDYYYTLNLLNHVNFTNLATYRISFTIHVKKTILIIVHIVVVTLKYVVKWTTLPKRQFLDEFVRERVCDHKNIKIGLVLLKQCISQFETNLYGPLFPDKTVEYTDGRNNCYSRKITRF